MDESGMGHSVADKYARSGHPSIQELVTEQGTTFRQDPAELLGDFWPEEESIEDFLRARSMSGAGTTGPIAPHDSCCR